MVMTSWHLLVFIYMDVWMGISTQNCSFERHSAYTKSMCYCLDFQEKFYGSE